jgi:hypothetical protein
VKSAILYKFKELHHTEKHHCKKSCKPYLVWILGAIIGVLHVPLVWTLINYTLLSSIIKYPIPETPNKSPLLPPRPPPRH